MCAFAAVRIRKQCGYSLCRTATAQDSNSTAVSRSNLEPGRHHRLLQDAKTTIGQAAIYIGDGQFIHASSSAGKVVITSLSATYYDTTTTGQGA